VEPGVGAAVGPVSAGDPDGIADGVGLDVAESTAPGVGCVLGTAEVTGAGAGTGV